MIFEKSLKNVEEGTTVGRIENSGRRFACNVCRRVTVWVDVTDPTHPGVHVCSDECLDVEDENRKETNAIRACSSPDLPQQQTSQGDLGNDQKSSAEEGAPR